MKNILKIFSLTIILGLNIGGCSSEPKVTNFIKSYGCILPFENGLAWVQTASANGAPPYQGYIDKKGREIIPAIYEYVDNKFNSGIVRVVKKNNDESAYYGLADANGNIIIPPNTYKYIGEFNEGLAFAVKEYISFGLQSLSPVCFINTQGNVVIPFEAGGYLSNTDFVSYMGPQFKNGFVRIQNKEGKWGYMNKRGQIVVPCVYDMAHDIDKYGLATIKKNGYWGLISKNEGVIYNCIFNSISAYNKDFICAQHNGNYVMLDLNGNILNGATFMDMYSLDDHVVRACNSIGEWGFLDSRGRPITAFEFEAITRENIGDMFDEKGYYLVKKSGKYGVVDGRGTLIIPTDYDHISYEEQSGLISLIDVQGFCNYFNTHYGIKILPPSTYTSLGYFSEGMAFFYKANGKKGYINKFGEEVIKNVKADYIFEFHDGLARVSVGGKSGFIDKSGKLVIPKRYNFARDFSEGISSVSDDRGTFLIDTKGNPIN